MHQKCQGFMWVFFLARAHHLFCWDDNSLIFWFPTKVVLLMLVIRVLTFLQSFIQIVLATVVPSRRWTCSFWLIYNAWWLALLTGILSTIFILSFFRLDIFLFGFPNSVTVVWFYQMSTLTSYLMQITPVKHSYGSSRAQLLQLYQIP